MDLDLINLKRKVKQYGEVLKNAKAYRQVWKDSLKSKIIKQLEEMIAATDLEAKVESRTELENLDSIVLSLGEVKSGMYQKVNENINRDLIKFNGALIYQQLFNGKIVVLINYPQIEDYSQPKPPKTIAIYRPEELKEPFLIRHLEEFVQEITNWEDYDDDEPMQRIGFQRNVITTEEPPNT